jgi:PAS domain S-box-containing protein
VKPFTPLVKRVGGVFKGLSKIRTFSQNYLELLRIIVSRKKQMENDTEQNGQKRVLIADDSPTVLGILSLMLESEGYCVIQAKDGLEALNKAFLVRPDLVLLDIFMPKINGYQVCRMLKSDESTANIPIIMLTGSEKGDKFWSLETGADEFRTKDFEFHGLLDKIEELILIYEAERSAADESCVKEPEDEVEIFSKLSHLLDRELYKSTLEKIRLETILNCLNEGVFTIDSNKQVTVLNRYLQNKLELDPKEIIGRKCEGIIGLPVCVDECLFEKAMSSQDVTDNSTPFSVPVSAETTMTTPDGEQIPVNVYLSMLKDHVGKTVGAVCVLQDISRLKEIQRMNTQLGEAYEELRNTQAQLVRSEKLASLGRLVAGAAHELNNPISFIYSNIYHLRKYMDDMRKVLGEYGRLKNIHISEVADHLTRIENMTQDMDLEYTLKDLNRLIDDMDEGAKRTKGIVEDLKTFSRSEPGRIELTEINDDIEKSLNLLAEHYKGRINIHKEYGDLKPVKCYSGQISRVFMNVLSNAFQAIKDRGDVWIITAMTDDTVEICIKDNGIGIHEDNIDKIFDPFFTTKEVGEGAGLGLSISYGIIRRHKGEIIVDSELGVGTRFIIRVPVDFEHVDSNN